MPQRELFVVCISKFVAGVARRYNLLADSRVDAVRKIEEIGDVSPSGKRDIRLFLEGHLVSASGWKGLFCSSHGDYAEVCKIDG